jgi:hypothetical protein
MSNTVEPRSLDTALMLWATALMSSEWSHIHLTSARTYAMTSPSVDFILKIRVSAGAPYIQPSKALQVLEIEEEDGQGRKGVTQASIFQWQATETLMVHSAIPSTASPRM